MYLQSCSSITYESQIDKDSLHQETKTLTIKSPSKPATPMVNAATSHNNVTIHECRKSYMYEGGGISECWSDTMRSDYATSEREWIVIFIAVSQKWLTQKPSIHIPRDPNPNRSIHIPRATTVTSVQVKKCRLIHGLWEMGLRAGWDSFKRRISNLALLSRMKGQTEEDASQQERKTLTVKSPSKPARHTGRRNCKLAMAIR